MGLDTISAAVAAHYAAGAGQISANKSQALEKRRKEMERRGTIIMLSGGALIVLMVLFVLIASGSSLDFASFGIVARLVLAIGLLTTISGIGVGIYPRLTKESDEIPRNTTDLESTNPSFTSLPSASNFEPVPSVIEHTTRTLEPLAKKERITAETK
jgi:hypothetical protein